MGVQGAPMSSPASLADGPVRNTRQKEAPIALSGSSSASQTTQRAIVVLGPSAFLLPFAAGNFLYIAATDLVPEILRHPRLRGGLLHLTSFAAGLGLLLWLHHALEHHGHG